MCRAGPGAAYSRELRLNPPPNRVAVLPLQQTLSTHPSMRDLYASIPIHRRPVFLVLNRVFLTQNAAFTVAVLMSPFDDVGSGSAAPTRAPGRFLPPGEELSSFCGGKGWGSSYRAGDGALVPLAAISRTLPTP